MSKVINLNRERFIRRKFNIIESACDQNNMSMISQSPGIGKSHTLLRMAEKLGIEIVDVTMDNNTKE